jgi:hypothetical protein
MELHKKPTTKHTKHAKKHETRKLPRIQIRLNPPNPRSKNPLKRGAVCVFVVARKSEPGAVATRIALGCLDVEGLPESLPLPVLTCVMRGLRHVRIRQRTIAVRTERNDLRSLLSFARCTKWHSRGGTPSDRTCRRRRSHRERLRRHLYRTEVHSTKNPRFE